VSEIRTAARTQQAIGLDQLPQPRVAVLKGHRPQRFGQLAVRARVVGAQRAAAGALELREDDPAGA